MINIGHFLSISTQLALQACEFIRDGAQNKDLKKYQKSANDPVTQTDYKVQSMIISGLHKHFPKLRIIGQQTVKYQGQIHTDYQNLQMNFLPQKTKLESEVVNAQQLCVWIDPIDNTKGFIGGQLEGVTVLIGLSRNLTAYAGVIGVPFINVKQKRVYSPQVTIGLVSTQETFNYTVKKVWEKTMIKAPNKPLVLTTTSALSHGLFDQLIQLFQGIKKTAGGSGNKIMIIVRGEADFMCYLAAYTHKWDSCAGEAIIKSLGGYFSDSHGYQLIYDPDNKNTINSKGFICTLNKELYQKSLIFLKQAKLKK